MANQTPDDSYIKDLLARLRANIDSDSAEEAEREAQYEKENETAPIDVYDDFEDEKESEKDLYGQATPPASFRTRNDMPQEDVFKEDDDDFMEEELPAHAEADPYISLIDEEENLTFDKRSRDEWDDMDEDEEESEEDEDSVLDVYGTAAQASEEDEDEQDYYIPPILNRPLFEQTPASDEENGSITNSALIEETDYDTPQGAEEDVAFALSVAPVREREETPAAEQAEPPKEKQSLLPPFKGLVRMRESYDTVSQKNLAENELCPHSPNDPIAKSNVALITRRALTVRRRRTIAATVATALFCLFALLYETIPAVSLGILSTLGLLETPGMAPAMDFIALFIPLLIFLPRFRGAVLALKQRLLTPDFVAFVCAGVTALFLLVRVFVGGVFFVALPAIFMLLVAQLCHLFALSASFSSAQICLESQGGATTVIRSPSDLPDVTAALQEKAASKRQIMSVARFTDSSAFLKKLGNTYLSPRFSLVSVILGCFLSALCAVLYGLVTDFAYIADIFGVFCAVLCATVPLSLFMLHSYSYRRLSRTLRDSKMAAAGEGAVYEGADADVLCYADLEAIPAENVEVVKIKLSGNNRMDLVFGYLSALFAKVGGPLDGHFRVSGEAEYVPQRVTLTEVEEDGITATIDGVCFRAGRGAYMQRHGIPFYYDAEDELQLENDKTAIMFTAMDGMGSAKLYLRYTFSQTFEELIADLEEQGVSAIIRTCDPNITPALLSRIAGTAKGKVGIIRNRLIQEAPAVETVTDGLIAFGVTPKGIYKTRFLFAAYRRMQQRLPIFSFLIAPLCALLCTVMALHTEHAFLLSLWAFACQVFSALPLMVAIETLLHKFPIGEDPDDQ